MVEAFAAMRSNVQSGRSATRLLLNRILAQEQKTLQGHDSENNGLKQMTRSGIRHLLKEDSEQGS